MDCIFCAIASGNIPSEKLYEDESVMAFRDINAQAPIHVLIIPKRHVADIMELEDDALLAHMFKVTRDLAKSMHLDKHGFRLVVNTGEDGGQTVGHLHMHLLGARKLEWPPG